MGFVTMRFWTGELHLPAGEILSVKRSYSFKEVRRSILKAVSKREILSGVSYRLKTRAGKVYRAKDVEVALGFVTMKFWTGELRLPAGELLSVKKTYLETLPSQ